MLSSTKARRRERVKLMCANIETGFFGIQRLAFSVRFTVFTITFATETLACIRMRGDVIEVAK